MKTRNGFVSNSSSSSFIVISNKPKTCESIQLSIKNANKIVEYIRKNKDYGDPITVTYEPFNTVYLTSFLSDSGDMLEEEPQYIKDNCYAYCEGGHDGPYDEEAFIDLDDSTWSGIWILKEHYAKPSKGKDILQARIKKSKKHTRLEDLIL